MQLTDAVVLVTGGAHRLGKAIAINLAELKPRAVIFTFNSSEAAAKETEAELRAMGVEVAAIRCNQSDVEQIRQTIAWIQAEYGRLDVLINSASIFLSANFYAVSEETWDVVMDTNARGPMFFMQFAAPLMQEKGGCMINIIDESVKKPALAFIHHGAAKAALWNLTKSAALALAPQIRVNAVLPGAVLKPPDYSEERWERNIATIPLKKVGSAGDVTGAVRFIISSEFMTGQAIVVDGGSTVV